MSDITIDQWAAHLRKITQGGELVKAIQSIGVKLALEGKRHAVFGVTNSPGGVRVRSGALRRSIKGKSKGIAGGAEITISSNSRYASTHEQDGKRGSKMTIKRKPGGPHLTIPIHSSLKTAAGDTKGISPHDVPDLKYIVSKKGNKLLVKSIGKEIEPWFLLLDEVEIPARPFLRPALDHIKSIAEKTLVDTIADVVAV